MDRSPSRWRCSPRLWLLQRQGRPLPDRTVSRAIGVSIGVLVLVAIWGLVTAWARHTGLPSFHLPPVALWTRATSLRPPVWLAAISAIVALASGIGFALPVLGGVDVLNQVAVDLAQPRIRNLRRIVRVAAAFGLLVAAGFAFLLVLARP